MLDLNLAKILWSCITDLCGIPLAQRGESFIATYVRPGKNVAWFLDSCPPVCSLCAFLCCEHVRGKWTSTLFDITCLRTDSSVWQSQPRDSLISCICCALGSCQRSRFNSDGDILEPF